MSLPKLIYKYTSITGEPEIEITQPDSRTFYFPLLANVTSELRPLLAAKLIEELERFVAWLDEPPTDWAWLLNNLPPLEGSYAKTFQEKEPVYASA